MKMKFIFATATIALLAFASCRKDYSCYCTDNAGTKFKAAQYTNVKKATAESACNSYEVYGYTGCDIE